MFCTHCGSRLPDGAVFCPTCGRQANRGVSCPNCTYRLPIGAVFCGRCGRAVGPPPPVPGTVHEDQVPTDRPPTPTDVTQGVAPTAPDASARVPDAIPPPESEVTPPRLSNPEAVGRVLPSNVASWTSPETNASQPSRSLGRPSPADVGVYPPSRAEWGYGATPVRPSLDVLIEPTVGGVYGHAWATVRNRFWGLFVIGLVATIIGGLISGAVNGIGALLTGATDLQVFSVTAQLLGQALGTWPIWAGVQFANLQTVRFGRAEIDDIFVPYRRGLLRVIVAQFVTTALVVGAFAFLIVPGVVVGLRLSFVTLLVVDEGYSPIEAIRESWRRTSGFGWTLLGIGLVAIPVALVGLLALIVGVIPAVMVIALTTPTMFAAVTDAHLRRAYDA